MGMLPTHFMGTQIKFKETTMLCEDNIEHTYENKIINALQNDVGKKKHQRSENKQ